MPHAEFHTCLMIDPRLVQPDSLLSVNGSLDGRPIILVNALQLEGGRIDHSILFPVADWPEEDARNRCTGILEPADPESTLEPPDPGSAGPVGGTGPAGTGLPPGQLQRPAAGVRRMWMRRIVAQPVSIGVGPPRYVKARGGGVNRKAGAATIDGIAAVYYDGTPETEYEIWDGLIERIMPGAFDAVIADGHDVLALFNHERSSLLGRVAAGTLELSSTKKGLAYRISPGATTIATDVLEHVRRRDVTGSSFSFQPLKETWEHDTKRKLDVVAVEKVTVADVGPVTLPAYKSTEAEVVEARDCLGVATRLREYRERAARL